MGEYLCEGCKKFFGGRSLKKLTGKWLCQKCFKERNAIIKKKRKDELDAIMKKALLDAAERQKELDESQDLVSRAYKEKFPNSKEQW